MRMEKPALYRYADQVMRSFEINNEYQAPFSDTKHTVDVQDLNLNTIKDGSVVITRCRHTSAVYVIRVNDTERGRIVIVNPQKNLDMFVGSLIALK